MSRQIHYLLVVFLSAKLLSASSILNSPTVDTTQFRVTTFASGLPLVNSVIRAKDGSFLAVSSTGFGGSTNIVRLQDNNSDGVADGPPQVLYSNPGGGVGTQIKSADKLYYVGEFGTSSITALAPGASAGDPMSVVGSLQFVYPPNHGHPSAGIAVRQTPNTPGSVDLVFNIGSEFNDQVSAAKVSVSGLGLSPTLLDGDALYMVTINEATGLASNIRQIATGIRNVYGLAFHPATGDLYFADNAIDEDVVSGFSEPPQSDELNRISAADLGVNVLKFGYPNCFDAFRTGVQVEVVSGGCSGVTDSLINFNPIPNGTGEARSEGPTEIAFAPSLFPDFYKNGVFVGFSGGVGPNGTNNQNPLVFVDSTFSNLQHFIPSGAMGNILGVYSTEDSLFISDWAGTRIFQIAAINPVPEPSSLIVCAFALAALGARRRAIRG